VAAYEDIYQGAHYLMKMLYFLKVKRHNISESQFQLFLDRMIVLNGWNEDDL